MPQIDFCFPSANLHATAVHLQNLGVSVTQGKSTAQVEDQLVVAAVKMFEDRYRNQQAVGANLINEGVLQAAVLWSGVGAIFSADHSVYGDGVRRHQASVKVQTSGEFVVSVDLWVHLS